MTSARRTLPLENVGAPLDVAEDISQEDDGWIRTAFLEHSAFVRRLATRLLGPGSEADDVVQEAFLVAWRHRSRFQGPLPRTWLYGVTVRICSSLRRRSRWRRFLGLESVAEWAGPHDPRAELERADATRQVYGLLSHLSEKKRVVFILYELEGWSGEEIARAVDCPLKTVWTRLHHARREFQAHLEREQARIRKEGEQ